MTSDLFRFVRLRIPRDERFGTFRITAGEIDRADRAITSMRPERGPGVVKLGIENIFAMTARSGAIINYQRHDNFTRCFPTVGNILAPGRAPTSVTANPLASMTSIASVVAELSANLIGTMISSRARHSGR